MLTVVTGMPIVPSCSCMAGRVSGPAGNIRFKRSRCDYLFSFARVYAIFLSLFAGRLPYNRPQSSWLWWINASRGCPILWHTLRRGWRHVVYLRACQCCASSRDWASRITRLSFLLIRRLTFSENSHDWGSQIAYEAARERPDVFTAVVGISAPYAAAAGPYVPISRLALLIPHFAYQVYFADQAPTAIAELNTDIRRTLRATLRTAASPPPSGFLASNSSYLDAWKNVSTVGLEMMSPRAQCRYCSRYQQSRSSVRLRRIIGLTSTISRSSITVSIPVFLSDAVCSVANKLQTLSSIPTLCAFTFMPTPSVLLILANTGPLCIVLLCK
jgi:hypothetical protein